MDSAEYWTARNEIEERFSENYLRVLRLLNAYRSQGHQRGLPRSLLNFAW